MFASAIWIEAEIIVRREGDISRVVDGVEQVAVFVKYGDRIDKYDSEEKVNSRYRLEEDIFMATLYGKEEDVRHLYSPPGTGHKRITEVVEILTPEEIER